MTPLRKQLFRSGPVGRGGFLDPFFAPFRARKVPPRQTIGASGAVAFGGFLQQQEKDPRLIGRERYVTFSEILANCSVVSSGVRFYLNLLGKPSWKAEPADDTARARQVAEQVEAALFEMTTSWGRVVRRAASYKFHGFSVQEWTARRMRDGSLGFIDVEARPQATIERWDLDQSGTLFGVVQRSPQTQEEIYLPRGRLVYAVDDALNDTPEGMGIFRNTAEDVRRLRRYEQLEGFGFETDLRGVPVGRGPFDALQKAVDNGELSPEDKATYERGLRTFVQNHVKTHDLGLLLDSSTYETTDDKQSPSSVRKWDVELLQGSAVGLQEAGAAIDRLERRIARAIGTEHLLVGEGATGSLALSRDKSNNFALSVASALGDLAEFFQADLVSPLVELNGWPPELEPTLKMDAVQHRDVEQVTGALRDLAQAAAAVTPADEAFGEVFDLLGLTRPDVDSLRADAAITVGGGEREEQGEPAEDGGDEETPEVEGDEE